MKRNKGTNSKETNTILNLAFFPIFAVMEQLLHSKIIGKGQPLLILHGLFGMGDNWITLGRRFAEYFEVHLVDLRNHGRSFHDDCMHYEIMAEDVVNYINHHQLEKVNIIGHSMGGKTAMWLAMLHPELLEKIVVVDIAPRSYQQKHLPVFNALNKVDFSIISKRDEVKTILSQSIKEEKVLQFMLKNIYRISKDQLAFRFNLPVLYERYLLINEPLIAQSQYEGEVLFLKGKQSDYILEEDETLIHAHFPKSKIVEVPGASHWVHADNPEFLYEACINFLTK